MDTANYRVFLFIIPCREMDYGLEETAGEDYMPEDNPERESEESDDDDQKFNEMLIAAVEANRVLYDKSLRNYRNQDKINLAWKRVSEAVNFPGMI